MLTSSRGVYQFDDVYYPAELTEYFYKEYGKSLLCRSGAICATKRWTCYEAIDADGSPFFWWCCEDHWFKDPIEPIRTVHHRQRWQVFCECDDGSSLWWWRESDGYWFRESAPLYWVQYIAIDGRKVWWTEYGDWFYQDNGEQIY